MTDSEKRIRYSSLLDTYGELLTRRQMEIMEMSLYDDLSLSEIAENASISRQAAQDAIKNSEARLEKYEGSLKVLHMRETINGLLDEMEKNTGNEEKLMELISGIRNVLIGE